METRKARTPHATRRAAPAVASVPGEADAPEMPAVIHPDAPTNEESALLGGPISEESVQPDVATVMAGAEPGAASVARVGYAPIVRVDAARREIELCATSEALDSYGTVFDYAASKDAFTRWIGNVREMHERRAVGSRVSVRCDDAQRKVYVHVRISAGAADTWEKVLDGTLRGASIGASNVVWERQARRVAGRERLLNVATRYDLMELSLVDSPSNPDALGITIVRDAVPDAAVLDEMAPQRRGDLTSNPARDLTPGPSPTGRGEIVAVREATEGGDGALPMVGNVSINLSAAGTGRRDASGTSLTTTVAAEAGMGRSEPADDPNAPPEVRIAPQAAAHGWAAIRAHRDDEPLPEEGNRSGEPSHSRLSASPIVPRIPSSMGTLPAHGREGLKPSLVQLELWPPELVCSGGREAAPSGGMDTRAQGPFSTNAEGYPDVGVPARAEVQPTSALGVREEGNARERFHAAARGILMGCGCPLCEGALAALGEMGTADESETRALCDGRVGASGGRPDGGMRESALARALASGLSASVARMERVDESVRGLGGVLQTAVSRIADATGELRRRLEALEAQPQPGGPAAFAFDKTLALVAGGSGGTQGQPGAAEQRRALESLAGKLTDPQAQIAVAAELIRLQRGE